MKAAICPFRPSLDSSINRFCTSGHGRAESQAGLRRVLAHAAPADRAGVVGPQPGEDRRLAVAVAAPQRHHHVAGLEGLV